MTGGLRTVFVANRGEIAVRIVRACRSLGLGAVVAVSDADRDSLAARLADRAVCIGPAPAKASYLRPEALVAAALGTGCDAVHPGYGFLAERADFAQLCADHGLRFIGPSAAAIEAMGDKLHSREVAERVGVPVTPGSVRVASRDEARAAGAALGYPLLIKASAGGGGRGMRLARSAAEVADHFETASREAADAFGDPTVFIERFIEGARHVEIQVLGDTAGNVVHLGERDCSVQRRYQKLIEESPSPAMDEVRRRRMGGAAVALAREIGYVSAGTVEFLLEPDSGNFYFLEVNTRIQVEHPVTEMVTGVDLVAEQLRIAGGGTLGFGQGDVALRGHAIECRINAEAPERDFVPAPGRLAVWDPPTGEGIRLDSHCYPGYVVPPFYDSLLGKLIVHGADRAAAIERMGAALRRFRVEGVATTIPFHAAVLDDPDFRAGRVTTRWAEAFHSRWRPAAAGLGG